jgi:hypothetical protein
METKKPVVKTYRVIDARTGAELFRAGARDWDQWFDRNKRAGVIRAWAVDSDTRTEKRIRVELAGMPA